MLTVFNLQLLRFKREPALVIIFLLMTLLFVFFIAGTGGKQTVTIQTFSDNLSQAQMEKWLDRLNDESDVFIFEGQDRDTIEEEIRMSEISFALDLDDDNYRFLVGQDSQFLMAVNQHVEKIYRTNLRIQEVNEEFPNSKVVLQDFIEVEAKTLVGGVSNSEEAYANVIVGMTLYFSIFTILFGLMNIAEEKRSGTWDRLISTPLKKSEIYIGQLSHNLLIGVVQIGIAFFVFHQFFNYNFGQQYLSIAISVFIFVFAIVALGMLIISLIKTPQQLQAVIPIVSTSMAMLGGAFWPLEIVSNRIILFLGKMTPLYHGIQALKGAIIYNRGIDEILQPLSILLLMGVLFMGIGLNLMEGKRL